MCSSAAARASIQRGRKRFETRLEAHAVREDLAGHSRLARAKRVEDAELERVDIQTKRELVVELLLRDRALRHAEAAKGAGGHEMRVDGPSQSPVVRHAIGARGMHRHAVRNRRSPRGVGAGVEIGREIHGHETSVAHRADLCDHARRVALGRGHDRFAARVNHADRPIEQPGGDCDEGLNRQIELRAKTTADRRRDDPHPVWRDSKDLRDVVAVHVGRLRAGLDLDAVADTASKARLGFDVGVLDETGLESAFNHDVRGGEARSDIAARHASGRQDVMSAARMNAFGALFERLFERRERGPRAPGYGKRRKVEIAHRLTVADHQRDGLAAKAGEALREHRLVRESRNHAIAIRAGDIPGGEDGGDSRMSTLKRLDVAENERGVRVRRSDRTRRQRFGRPFVSAEDFRAREFAGAVEAGNTSPHRGLLRQLRNVASAEVVCVLHGVENGSITGAAAQHAGERVLDFLFAGLGLPSQQPDRGGEDAWRANAALRGAMRVQGGAQLRDDRLVVAEPLDRFNRTPFRLPNGGQAGANRFAVDQHSAGSAIASVAADLDARQSALLAQDMTEAFERGSGKARRFPVEGQRDAGRAFEHQTTPPVWRSAQASIARLSNVNAASRR